MSAYLPRMPPVAQYLVYNKTTNTYHYDYVQDKNVQNSGSETTQCPENTSACSSQMTDTAPFPCFGSFANDGCWYPLMPNHMPCQDTLSRISSVPICDGAPVIDTNIMQTPFGPNSAPQFVMLPLNAYGGALQHTSLNLLQMPMVAAPQINNTSNYFLCTRSTSDTVSKPCYNYEAGVTRTSASKPGKMQHIAPENTVLYDPAAWQSNGGMCDATAFQYCTPGKVMVEGLVAVQDDAQADVVKSVAAGSRQTCMKSVFNVSSLIEMLYCQLKGSGPEMSYGRPTLLTPFTTHRSPGLELVWKTHFGLLFGLLEGEWTLAPTYSAPKEGFLSFRDMAKVRFSCQFCLRGWTSMFGVILFFYCWNPVEKRGLVRFLLMGQSCNNCMKKNVFETPMWYPEEAEKVMTNLFYDVSSRVFGKVVPPFNYDRRYGRPRHHHNAQQCQGCSLHLCKPHKRAKNTTVTHALPNGEGLENGEKDSAAPDDLGMRVKALRVPGGRESIELGDTPAAIVTDEVPSSEFESESNEIPCGNIDHIVEVANGDNDDGVCRDPCVVVAITEVRKTLAERSAKINRNSFMGRNANVNCGTNEREFSRFRKK